MKFDGRSLAPLLTAAAPQSWPDRTLVVLFQQSTRPPAKWRAAAMTDRWRLVGQKALYDIRADAGQQADVAGKHPKVVAALRKAYEDWWAEMAKTFTKVSRIILGSDRANPVALTCFDWHTRTPWNQRHIRSAAAINGFWAVEIDRQGEYEFTLRRWPTELDKPITAELVTTEQYDEYLASADLLIEFYGVRLQAEYVWRYVDYSTPGVLTQDETLFAGGTPFDTMYTASYLGLGFYGLIAYELPLARWIDPVRIIPYFMYELNRHDDTKPNQNLTTYIGGINIKPSPYVTIKVEGGAAVPERNYYGSILRGFAAQLAVSF